MLYVPPTFPSCLLHGQFWTPRVHERFVLGSSGDDGCRRSVLAKVNQRLPTYAWGAFHLLESGLLMGNISPTQEMLNLDSEETLILSLDEILA